VDRGAELAADLELDRDRLEFLEPLMAVLRSALMSAASVGFSLNFCGLEFGVAILVASHPNFL
jgi:hypothetical protein